jgi:hypothetical protein
MTLRRKLARILAPDLLDADAVKALVADEVKQARQALPVNVDYDPKGEGFRPMSGAANGQRRDLTPVSQSVMIEAAYYYYDASGLVRRFVRDTRNFTVGKGFSWTVENDTEDDQAKGVLDDFWRNYMSGWSRLFDDRFETWYLLGELALIAHVNPVNGRVTISDIDPANITDVLTVPQFPGIPAAVELASPRTSRRLAAIREDNQPTSRSRGRLVGEVFYEALNKPPTAARGRSDLLAVFDFIESFEQGLFDELDRARFLKNFVWDVTLEGADDEQIRKYLQDQGAPKPGSVRAHNERVKWQAVAPQLNAQENKALFDTIKSYVAASQNRPDAWLGGGGKAYQNEADLMGEPTFMDLESRQSRNKTLLADLGRFAVDQAILHGEIPDGDYVVGVDTPDLGGRDMTRVGQSLSQLSTALSVAEEQRWCRKETAARIWASLASETGVSVDPDAEMASMPAPGSGDDQVTEDYRRRR